MFFIDHQQLGSYLLGHAIGKFGSRALIHGNCHGATENAAKKCGNPLARISSPEQNSIAWPYPACDELARYPCC